MAESLQPWIAQYLIDIAETHGANLTAVPYFSKKKKVQLVEFITYDLSSQDDCIWGKVSDKQFKIPVRLTKEAMSHYNSLNTRRLTEHKTALISITEFQPFFARIPLANKKGMSKMACLALNIKSFSIVGSAGEAEWGRPRDIEKNPDLLEWSQGLRKDGGEGNILMNRKKEREQSATAESLAEESPREAKYSPPSVARKRAHMGPKASSSKKTVKQPVNKADQIDALKEYERSWRPISLNTWKYTLKSPIIEEQPQTIPENIVSDKMEADQPSSPARPDFRIASGYCSLDLTSNQPKEKTPSPEHSWKNDVVPTTPSSWSPSVLGSPIPQSPLEDDTASGDELEQEPLSALSSEAEEPPDFALGDDLGQPNALTTELPSHPSPPTPAQRPKLYAPLPPTSSPPPVSSATSPEKNIIADSDTEDESEAPNQPELDHEADQIQDEEDKPQILQSHSDALDSQEDRLDKDDAQIDEMLFGWYNNAGPANDTEPVSSSINQAPPEDPTKDQADDILRRPTDNTSNPLQVSSPQSKDRPDFSPAVTPSPPGLSARSQAIAQRVCLNSTSQPDLMLSEIRPVNHDKEAWTNPSFMHRNTGKESVFASEFTDDRKGLLVGEKTSFSDVSAPAIMVSNGLLSGVGSGKMVVALNDQASYDSPGIHRSAHPVPGIHGGSMSGPTSAVGIQDSVSGRISSRPPENVTWSRKKSRESSAEEPSYTLGNGPKRRRLANARTGGASSSTTLDRAEGEYLKVSKVERPLPIHGSEDGREGGRTLNGFQVNLDNISCGEKGPSSFSWADLQQVLLRTGRKRTVEQRDGNT